jgi:hypothetical protein
LFHLLVRTHWTAPKPIVSPEIFGVAELYTHVFFEKIVAEPLLEAQLAIAHNILCWPFGWIAGTRAFAAGVTSVCESRDLSLERVVDSRYSNLTISFVGVGTHRYCAL